MTLGVLLTATSAYFAFRGGNGRGRSGTTSTASAAAAAAHQRDSLRTAAWIGSLYCVAGLSAILYPGATWNDLPEPPSYRLQLRLFSGLVVGNWVGYWIAVAGLGDESGGVKVE